MMRSLGNPPDFRRVTVTKLWDRFRVNAQSGDVLYARVSARYFFKAEEWAGV